MLLPNFPVMISMLSLPCTQCHIAKHAPVSMQTIPIMQVLLCNQCISAQICSRCYATNITQLKYTAVAMHVIPNSPLLLCNKYHSAEANSCCHACNTKYTSVAMQPIYHAAVAMHTIPNMQLLLCNQYHSAEAYSCCHA